MFHLPPDSPNTRACQENPPLSGDNLISTILLRFEIERLHKICLTLHHHSKWQKTIGRLTIEKSPVHPGLSTLNQITSRPQLSPTVSPFQFQSDDQTQALQQEIDRLNTVLKTKNGEILFFEKKMLEMEHEIENIKKCFTSYTKFAYQSNLSELPPINDQTNLGKEKDMKFSIERTTSSLEEITNMINEENLSPFENEIMNLSKENAILKFKLALASLFAGKPLTQQGSASEQLPALVNSIEQLLSYSEKINEVVNNLDRKVEYWKNKFVELSKQERDNSRTKSSLNKPIDLESNDQSLTEAKYIKTEADDIHLELMETRRQFIALEADAIEKSRQIAALSKELIDTKQEINELKEGQNSCLRTRATLQGEKDWAAVLFGLEVERLHTVRQDLIGVIKVLEQERDNLESDRVSHTVHQTAEDFLGPLYERMY